jgi:hypothetical protein
MEFNRDDNVIEMDPRSNSDSSVVDAEMKVPELSVLERIDFQSNCGV